MPPLPVVPGVVKLVIETVNFDSQALNIHHVQYSGGPPSSSDLEAFHGTILDSIEYVYTHNGIGSLDLVSASYMDLSSDTGATYESALSGSGSLEGDVLPMSSAVVVSHDILRRYRGGHPRTYLAIGSSDTFEADSTRVWQASFLANVQSDFESFRTATRAGVIGTINWLGLCNVSYRSGGELRVTPIVDLITGSVAKTRVCTQRRRLGKVGG
uniref:Uncharacterized protein n=1 Tax=uncultured prokaryote TaxID=198431 RepID=A0A0H5QJH1_9ZZZZ|nr:hypothetical protein [uncultured prokaryote]